ncbi:RHS repeat-associated core domain-containing protein [Fulvivirga ligni]|uniref:RHS repeat-associated core domain-containing protein n=1 Tax=Fulvivirga ligni TaxID=2904246 RepID=UPI001F1685FC|nr:RHS repeat-associated core domain-containing protein [Fulvivirga ligni]UII21158.1 fibronectin type III domain-containing protein [Fulvivirga ligni]
MTRFSSTYLTLTILVFLPFLSSAQTENTYLIDLGSTSTPTVGNWNNVPGDQDDDITISNLITDDGQSSTINFVVASAADHAYGDQTGVNTEGYNGVALGYPASACRDSYFSFSSGGSYKLTGLALNKQYSIKIFASRAASSGGRVGKYIMGGETLTLDAQNNTTNTIIFENLAADSNGELVMDFAPQSGSTFGYINVIEIIESSVSINAPTNLLASLSGVNTVILSWDDNSNNETGFTVERRVMGSGSFTVIDIGAGATSYTDAGLSYSTSYEYRIKAYNNDNESTTTSLVSIQTEADPNQAPGEVEAVYLIDLGSPNTLTAGNWNNVSGEQEAGIAIAGLISDQGVSSGINFVINSAADHEYGDGTGVNVYGYNGATLGYPISACSDSYFAYSTGGEYKFTGLNASNKYSIEIFGSRGVVAADRVGSYSINGLTLTLDAQNNSTSTIQFNDLQSDTNGEISLSFAPASGSSFGYINVITLVETPQEPEPYIEPTTELSQNPQYNGNISAIKWKTHGDETEQLYTYQYDAMNRITEANYAQGTSVANTWTTLSGQGGFSVPKVDYDLNGNIQHLNRQAIEQEMKVIDQLTYTYQKGNQLSKVDDEAGSGGFKDGNKSGDDYEYDQNGNMTKDLNKDIIEITYNHLNLPKKVTKEDGQYILYIYDAAGMKLAQEVHAADNALIKRTDYMGEFIYETQGAGSSELQLIQHEEGRIVPDATNGGWEYQYHLKDHLGNTRLTFTSKPKTHEFNLFYENTTGAMVTVGGEDKVDDTDMLSEEDADNIYTDNAYDHTDAGTTYQNTYVLNGNESSRAGSLVPLTVGAGDKVNVSVNVKLLNITSNQVNTPEAIGVILNNLLTAHTVLGGYEASNSINNGYGYSGGLLGTDSFSINDTVPMVFLNMLFIPEDGVATITESELKYKQVTDANNKWELLTLPEFTAPSAGTIMVYVSNESNTQLDAYFDDMQLTLEEMPIIQTDNYYPFGLAFNSYQRVTAKKNKFLYNGKERVSDLGLNWDDYGARMYQSELGRFFVQDRFSEKYAPISPYNYVGNNPILFKDHNGDSLILAFDNISAVLSFARRTLESLDGGNFKLKLSSTGEVDKNGHDYMNVQLEGGDPSKLSSGGSQFYQGLTKVIDSDESVKIGVGYGDPNVHTGHYAQKRIDMADIEQWPALNHSVSSQNGPTDAGKMIHEIWEQYKMTKYKDPEGSNVYYNKSHGLGKAYTGSALYWEDKVNNNDRLMDWSDKGVVQQYRLKNGSVVKYEIILRPVIIVVPYKGKNGIK